MKYNSVTLKEKLKTCFERVDEGTADEDEKYIAENVGRTDCIDAFCEACYTLGLLEY